MIMDNQLSVKCECGFKRIVTASQAGSTLACPVCQTELKVPRLSELKKQPAGKLIGVSNLEQLLRSIQDRRSPFDGKCQRCSKPRATNYLPVTVHYVEYDETRTFGIPCTFCDLCAGDVQSGLRYGVLANLAKNLSKCIWLLLMLPVVMFIAMLLPLIGIVFVLGTMSSLFYQVTRRRANPFLMKHLNDVCHFTEIMNDFDEYVVKNGRIQIARRYESGA